jgi:ribA/ribD-fused uncharacterized protein
MLSTTLNSYNLKEVISFYKVDETFGGLSNMSGKYFHLQINDLLVRSSESLYQCLRFTSYPHIQKEILENKSPKGSKMISKKYRKEFTREDLDEIKVELMYWCLKVKLCSHPLLFGGLLERTGDKEIVEISKSDCFWGCVREKENENIVTGENVLGRLLMNLREYFRENKGEMSLLKVTPLEINDFKLLGEEIKEIKSQILK